MAQYRFVGSYCHIMSEPKGYELKSWGQLVDLPEHVAEAAIAQDAPLVKTKVFDSVGFTPDELRRWTDSGKHNRAPQEFRDKIAKLHVVRKKKEEPVAPVVPEPTEEVSE